MQIGNGCTGVMLQWHDELPAEWPIELPQIVRELTDAKAEHAAQEPDQSIQPEPPISRYLKSLFLAAVRLPQSLTAHKSKIARRMTDFETFLRAVERLSEAQRLLVMGDESVIYPPDDNLGYDSTPKDSLAFGAMGVDGVHYLLLKLDGEVRNDSPVIHFSPMDFSNPYNLLGHSFRQYLATACGVSEQEIGAIIDQEQQGEAVLAEFIRGNLDHSRFDLDGFGSQIKQYSHLLPPVDP